ncbi:Cellulosomal protein [Enhygromyxa salina]|uniref:Cellulosomal protein n=1 Tax=Enhygromyxa salina TaxID=215803 RepID=A0A0C2CV18_9BACT|nr:CotH kinase family protein [Enhygromyxa salina]KIG14971.1 Cellulosomal protein [Enhygromyxa salina]
MQLIRLSSLVLLCTLTLACGDDPGLADSEAGTGKAGTGETDGTEEADSSDSSDNGTDGGAGLCDDDPADLVRPDGWGRDSHCKGATPDYDRLFDDTKVQRLDLTIDPLDYADMRSDLDDMAANNNWNLDPIYVPADVAYDGKTWWQVGVRYKGNSSLHSATNQGIDKLALRFKFDEYEADNPELVDQRFYGFKKMTFSNAYKDNSLIRDKLAGDIFRAAGVPVARSAFVRIYVDVGQGPTYWGLYTMIEDPSNKMLDTQFADASGNLYKPDGAGARLQSFDADSMIKKTNEELADYADVEELISVLNSGSGAQWRAELESVFDVDGFLTLLAVNQSIVNWDSYGWMTHNYYLYADPSDGLIKWIPWDLNESLLIQGGGGGPGPGGGGGGPGGGSDSVLLDEISAQWPMIRRLLDDEVYSAAYRDKLLDLQTGAFDLQTTTALAQTYHDLITPYVVGADGEQPGYTFLNSDAAFESSISGGNNAIADHIADRHADVSAAL